MQHLNTQPHFGIPGQRAPRAYSPGDDFYEMLIAAHQGLSDEHSELLQARLVLLLANHIGDLRVLREALQLAREGVDDAASAGHARS
jgi:Protein of unknown function (DUF2783)